MFWICARQDKVGCTKIVNNDYQFIRKRCAEDKNREAFTALPEIADRVTMKEKILYIYIYIDEKEFQKQMQDFF